MRDRRISIRVEEDLYNKAKEYAEEKGWTISRAFREGLERLIEEEKLTVEEDGLDPRIRNALGWYVERGYFKDINDELNFILRSAIRDGYLGDVLKKYHENYMELIKLLDRVGYEK